MVNTFPIRKIFSFMLGVLITLDWTFFRPPQKFILTPHGILPIYHYQEDPPIYPKSNNFIDQKTAVENAKSVLLLKSRLEQ